MISSEGTGPDVEPVHYADNLLVDNVLDDPAQWVARYAELTDDYNRGRFHASFYSWRL